MSVGQSINTGVSCSMVIVSLFDRNAWQPVYWYIMELGNRQFSMVIDLPLILIPIFIPTFSRAENIECPYNRK